MCHVSKRDLAPSFLAPSTENRNCSILVESGFSRRKIVAVFGPV